MFVGFGTVTNVITVTVGALLGWFLGNRLPERVRSSVTQVLGLVTLVIGGLSAATVTSAALASTIGNGVSLLVVLGSLLIGSIVGSLLRLEARLEAVGDWLRARLTRGGSGGHFVEGFVTSTLVFCVGPLTVLGSLSDGLGRGAEQLLVKSAMDGFAAMAFASTLGVGVLLSAVSVGVVQGSLTLLGFLAGDVLPIAHIDALTATGGVILLGLGFRLLDVKAVPVGDFLPALVVAPLLVQLIAVLR